MRIRRYFNVPFLLDGEKHVGEVLEYKEKTYFRNIRGERITEYIYGYKIMPSTTVKRFLRFKEAVFFGCHVMVYHNGFDETLVVAEAQKEALFVPNAMGK